MSGPIFPAIEQIARSRQDMKIRNKRESTWRPETYLEDPPEVGEHAGAPRMCREGGDDGKGGAGSGVDECDGDARNRGRRGRSERGEEQ